MNQQLSQMQAAINNSDDDPNGSWFEAMADAWGQALNEQAGRIEALSAGVGEGIESPQQITELTAESLRMQYLSNASHTSITAVGSSLETLARKQ